MSAPDWLISRPIAHRGLHNAKNGIVENSPGAIDAAVQAGHTIEIDVQLTADGTAVVFHDETLDRLTDTHGPLIERSVDELREIAYRGTSDHIVSLADALTRVDGRVPLVIEVKSQWGNVGPLERCVTEALEDYEGAVALMSFDPTSVSELRRLAPAIPRGIVACRFHDAEEWSQLSSSQRFRMRYFMHLLFTRPQFISYDVDDLPSTAVRILRALGMHVICWTVRSEDRRRFALNYTDQITFEGFKPDLT